MQDIIIFGSGGLAREVAFVIEEINKHTPTWSILGFVETDKDKVGHNVGKYTIFSTEDELTNINVSAAIGIGNPKTIKNIAMKFKNNANINFPNLIHPNTVWDKDRVFLNKGNIICAGNVFTTDIHIDSFNYLNLNCTYGHDIEIGKYCVINPGVNISGGTKIGNSCLLGTGATILQGITIQDNAIIGAGAVVTKDVMNKSTVIGVPARPLNKTPSK